MGGFTDAFNIIFSLYYDCSQVIEDEVSNDDGGPNPESLTYTPCEIPPSSPPVFFNELTPFEEMLECTSRSRGVPRRLVFD